MTSERTGKIGFHDSGDGGIQILKAAKKLLPKYYYVSRVDSENFPYGNKTQTQLRSIVKENLSILFSQKCTLIIIACNTASAKALRHIQKYWLPKEFPNKKVLGVIVPTIENLHKQDFPALLLATKSTVESNAYKKEVKKLYPKMKLFQRSAPQLATLIENRKNMEAFDLAIKLILPFENKVKSVILGCTHYSVLAKSLRKKFPDLRFISQTEIVPTSLRRYLRNHAGISKQLKTKRK